MKGKQYKKEETLSSQQHTLNNDQAKKIYHGDQIFEVIIVGGGIVGLGLFRDLILNGRSCLLLEKGDFASQSSSASSKMLHGGIRYMENGDLPLVFEALHEKNLWLKLAPDLAREISFCLPIYKESKYPLWMTSIGLKLYDLLSGFQNHPHKILNARKTLELVPQLRSRGLRGAGIYYDAVVDDAKLALAVLKDALKAAPTSKCFAHNYFEVTKIIKSDNPAVANEVLAQDTLTKKEYRFYGQEVIIAGGPFTDNIIHEQLGMKSWQPKLLLSKGIHLLIDKRAFPLTQAVVLQTKDGRLIFVIPMEETILVGTTETSLDPNEPMFNIKASPKDINYLLENLRNYFPEVDIKEQDIVSSFAGIRPLIAGRWGTGAHKTSRRHSIYQITKRIYAIAGGKYTTFRVMGQKLVKQIIDNLNDSANLNDVYLPHRPFSPYRPELTKTPLAPNAMLISSSTLLHKRPQITADLLESICDHDEVRTFEDLVVRRLGIPNRKYWDKILSSSYGGISFDKFFNEFLPILAKHLPITPDEIERFK